jgi:hypothetical protein
MVVQTLAKPEHGKLKPRAAAAPCAIGLADITNVQLRKTQPQAGTVSDQVLRWPCALFFGRGPTYVSSFVTESPVSMA